MTLFTARYARIAGRTTIIAAGLLATATGTAAAHGGGSYGGGGMMGGGGLGLFGGTMGVWGLLWMGLLVALPAYLVYTVVTRDHDGGTDSARGVLRERYARGELSEEEFERRRARLDKPE